MAIPKLFSNWAIFILQTKWQRYQITYQYEYFINSIHLILISMLSILIYKKNFEIFLDWQPSSHLYLMKLYYKHLHFYIHKVIFSNYFLLFFKFIWQPSKKKLILFVCFSCIIQIIEFLICKIILWFIYLFVIIKKCRI